MRHSPGNGEKRAGQGTYRWKEAQNQVPPGQSLASRPVGNPTCKPGNGSTELGGTRKQAALLSPEIGIVVDRRINSRGRKRGKADAFHAAEGSSPRHARAKCAGHHRGLRTGHVSRGATRKLGRANCLLKAGQEEVS